MKVTIYTITDCPFCKAEKDYLKERGITFEEKNLESNKAFLAEMLEASDKFAGVPFTVILKDDGNTVKLRGFTKEEFDDVFISKAVAAAPATTAGNEMGMGTSVPPMSPSSIPTGSLTPGFGTATTPADSVGFVSPNPSAAPTVMPPSSPSAGIASGGASNPNDLNTNSASNPSIPTDTTSTTPTADPAAQLDSLLASLKAQNPTTSAAAPQNPNTNSGDPTVATSSVPSTTAPTMDTTQTATGGLN